MTNTKVTPRMSLILSIANKTHGASIRTQANFIANIQNLPIAELAKVARNVKVQNRRIVY
jgi:hypothetical protein